jgi:hypothetical protein
LVRGKAIAAEADTGETVIHGLKAVAMQSWQFRRGRTLRKLKIKIEKLKFEGEKQQDAMKKIF